MSTVDVRIIVDELVVELPGGLDARAAEAIGIELTEDLGRRLEAFQAERVLQILGGSVDARPVHIDSLRLSIAGSLPSVGEMSASLARTVMERVSR